MSATTNNEFFSKHALVRMQQRGVKAEIIDIILEWGTSYVTHGDELFYIPKKIAKKVLRNGSGMSVDDVTGIYLIMRNGKVHTVAHKTNKRFHA